MSDMQRAPRVQDVFRRAMRAYTGTGGETKDNFDAARLFRIAADLGHAESQYYYAMCHERAEGLPLDNVAAAHWFRLSAEQGDESAQLSLGECYRFGRGLAKDNAKAIQWLSKSASKGNPRAQDNLAQTYLEQGMVVEAARYAHLAADQGMANSCCIFAQACLLGLGVPQDYGMGARYHRKGADLDHVPSM